MEGGARGGGFGRNEIFRRGRMGECTVRSGCL